MRTAALIYLVALLLGLLPAGAALAHEAHQAAPGPVFRYMTRFDAAPAPETFDQIMLVLDFAPGAWTPPHTHGGHVYTTVVEGEMSARLAGMPATEKKYKPGETWVETPGEYMEAGNAGGAKARLLVTAILPKGAPLTTNQAGVGTQNPPPGPTTVYRTTLDAIRPGAPFEVVQFLVDFNPGAATPVHTHPGRGFATVLTGEMMLRTGGREQTFKAGEFWIDEPGVVYVHGNTSGAFAQVGVSFLLPKGAPVLHAQAAAAAPAQLPRTGGLGAPLLAVGGGGLAAVGWLLRRRTGRQR
jgi:quercetin dioxygenase-like cupin family protein